MPDDYSDFLSAYHVVELERATLLGRMIGTLKNLVSPQFPPTTEKEFIDGINKVLQLDIERDEMRVAFWKEREKKNE